MDLSRSALCHVIALFDAWLLFMVVWYFTTIKNDLLFFSLPTVVPTPPPPPPPPISLYWGDDCKGQYWGWRLLVRKYTLKYSSGRASCHKIVVYQTLESALWMTKVTTFSPTWILIILLYFTWKFTSSCCNITREVCNLLVTWLDSTTSNMAHVILPAQHHGAVNTSCTTRKLSRHDQDLNLKGHFTRSADVRGWGCGSWGAVQLTKHAVATGHL